MTPHSPNSPLLPPAIGEYELLRQIGRGSYGDVWLARSITGSFRAVKIVWRNRFADAAPFEREFRGLTEFANLPLGSAYQLAITHVGKNDEQGFFYYVMEAADDVATGRAIDPARYVPLTLTSLRARRGRLPVSECVVIASDLARALVDLHGRGLVHRDIKPSNVVFVGSVPKLADIGLLAKATDARTLVGTEGYIPPEGPGTVSADIFGLGKLIYEMATGMDLSEFPRLPPALGELPDHSALLELNEVILRACARLPEERYASASQLLADLAVLTQGRSIRRIDARRRRLRLALKVAGVALLTSLAFLVWKERRTIFGNPETALQHTTDLEKLLAQVKSLTDGVYTREGVLTADELARHATAIAPQSSRAWGLLAYCGACQLQRNWDISDARREEVQRFANHALAIDPDDPMALLSLAILHRRQLAHAQSEVEARHGLKANPDDPRIWRLLINAIFSQGRYPEAFAVAEDAKRRFPKDPLLYYELSLLYGQRDDFAHFEEYIETALSLKPFPAALLTKVDVVTYRHGDLARARAAFSQVDPKEQSDDRSVACAMYLGALERDPARIHQAARLTANSYIADFVTRGGPKEFWEAIAYRLEGKAALEREQWQRGLEVLQSRRQNRRDIPTDQARLATALVAVGRLEEAAREISLYEATYREQPKTEKALMLAAYYAARADAKRAVPYLTDALNRWSGVSYPLLRLHPWWDNLRGQPEFEALLAAAPESAARPPPPPSR